jgi:2-(1,2-epoxy-1,2-dihydrophenyl)acetyl-CoA isomerase
MNAEDRPLLYDVGADGVAVITLNRADRMNSITPEMLDLWVAAIDDAAVNDQVGAVVVTGAGQRAFCVGADLAGGHLGGGDEEEEVYAAAANRNVLRYTIHRIPRALRQLDKPYLAAVNGAATGAGMDMASMADMRFVSDTARFAMSYVRVGVVPGDGGAFYLPRLVGLQRALHLLWTGELFGAADAVAWGYAFAALPPDQLLPHVRQYAAALAAGPRTSVELIKGLVYRGLESTESEALGAARWAMALVRSTSDSREGPAAFAEKRPPNFTGR